MKDDYKNKLASKIASRYQDLEERIMQDIVRRIVKAGEITSTADWQINRLRILGYSSEDIEKEIKKALNASYPEMFELYDKVINWEYVRNKDIYEQINAEYIPFEENGQLKQITEAIIDQSFDDLENVTNSLGFYLDYGNSQKVLTPLSQVYPLYDKIMAEDGVIAKVENCGYMVNGHMADISMRAKLRGLKNANGDPLFKTDMQGSTQYALDGSPMNFPNNGSFDKTKALMISGDFSQLVYSIRQDITFKLFTEGVVQNTDGSIAYNLMQNDMVALRAVMRLGWEIPNPINALAKDKTKRCPFSILKAGE